MLEMLCEQREVAELILTGKSITVWELRKGGASLEELVSNNLEAVWSHPAVFDILALLLASCVNLGYLVTSLCLSFLTPKMGINED